MKQLKDLAKTIAVNFVRVGFDPMTEQTKFVCIINGMSFDFSCGLRACVPDGALAKLKRRYNSCLCTDNSARVFELIMQGRVKASKNLDNGHNGVALRVFRDISMLCAPTAYDLLYCLRSDAESVNESFDSWCSNFGYDNDSIKALNTYNACVENARKLKIALGCDLFREVMESEAE
jgi:hypothetical protein